MARPAVTQVELAHVRNIGTRMPLLNLIGYLQVNGGQMLPAYMQLRTKSDVERSEYTAELDVVFLNGTRSTFDVLDIEDVHNDVQQLGEAFVRAGLVPQSMYTALRYSGAV